MDLATIGGMIFGVVVLIIVIILEGGTPLELISNPGAIFLIFGGSLAATTIASPLSTITKIPTYLKIAMTIKPVAIESTIEMIVKMADKARREGLLALEEESKKITDPFLQKGIMMVVDGIDIKQIQAIMENNIEQMAERHRRGIGLFATAGGFSPTFGIIGTVMGLINVLKQLDDPAALAHAIAAAFLATLWGLLSANLIFLPISGKLKSKNEEEVSYRYLILEGILSIQAGENPRVIRDKLNTFLSPDQLKAGTAAAKKAPASAKPEAGKAGARS